MTISNKQGANYLSSIPPYTDSNDFCCLILFFAVVICIINWFTSFSVDIYWVKAERMQIWLSSEICWVWVSFVGWNSSFLQLLRKLIPALYLGCTAARAAAESKMVSYLSNQLIKGNNFLERYKTQCYCCPMLSMLLSLLENCKMML